MSRRRLTWLLALALFASVLLAYAPIGAHEFVNYDDEEYLLANPHVARGLDWAEIRWVFTHPYAGNYHPLTWVSHMLDVQLFELAPGPHHWVNVVLHGVNAVLAFALLSQVLSGPWTGALAASWFALHPLRVESVAWAAERKDVLCAAFTLATLLLYLRYGRAPSAGRMLLVLMGAALALLAKPMAVTLPALVLLLDVWPLQRWRAAATGRARAALLLEKLPLLALAALGALTTLWAQSAAGSTSSLGALGPGLRLLNALASLAAYVGQTFRPLELSVFYPHAAIVAAAPVRALLAPAAAGLALLVLGLVLAWRARHRAPGALLGLALFLLLLAPVIGLVQVGTQAHADRYTYLPSVGLCAALVAGAVALGAGRRSAALGFAVSALLGVITNVQLGVWHDTRSLFAHALELDERNYLAHSKLGEVALAEGDIPAARTAFQRALDLYPRFAHALGKVALCDLAERKLEDARERLTRALAWEPDDYELRLNLGVVELERGELEAAERHFAACRARAPAGPDALLNLGVVAQRRQRWEDAQARFEEAVALAPEHGDAWSHLGQARLARGDLRAAEAAFRRAAELAPEDPLAHFNLGVALRKQSQREAAEAAFRRALALDPELEPARAALHELEAGG